MIILILAQDQENGIGKNNSIPWHIPEDLKFFKKITTDYNIIMGRNTWNSLPVRPLPNRCNYVLTNTGKLAPPTFYDGSDNLNKMNIKISCSINQLINNLNQIKNENNDNINLNFIIGGKQIYEQFLNQYSDLIDVIIITKINKIFDCDIKLSINWDKYFEDNRYILYKEIHLKTSKIEESKEDDITYSHQFYAKKEENLSLIFKFSR